MQVVLEPHITKNLDKAKRQHKLGELGLPVSKIFHVSTLCVVSKVSY